MRVPRSHLGTEGRPIGWGDGEEVGVALSPRHSSRYSQSAGSKGTQDSSADDIWVKACVDMEVTREVGAARPLSRGGVKVVARRRGGAECHRAPGPPHSCRVHTCLRRGSRAWSSLLLL